MAGELNININTDSGGYVEGYQINWAEAMVKGLAKVTWLGPQTATILPLNDVGQVYIPVTERSAKSGFTDICVEATPDSVTNRYIKVEIDGKHSSRFDGCFTSTGIADKNWEKTITNAKLKYLANDMQDKALQTLQAGAFVSETIKSSYNGDVVAYFNAMIVEYALKNDGNKPDVVLVSWNFYAELLNTRVFIPNNNSNDVLTTGVLGKIMGVDVIPVITDNDIDIQAMYRKEMLVIAYPTNPKSMPNASILGAVDTGNMGDETFFKGMQTMHEYNAAAGTIFTWLHMYRGYKVIQPNSVLISEAVTVPAV